MKVRVRALPLEPIRSPVDTTANIPLNAFQQIEAAALQLLQAVRAAGQGIAPASPATGQPGPALCVVDLCNEFLLAKARAGRSDGYLGLLIKQLRAFVQDRAGRAVASVGAAEIESWLYAQPWADKTRHGALLTLRTLFDFAVGRAYLAGNPALAVDLPTLTPTERGVHSPGQVRTVLQSCADPSTLRYLAIRYFAGLRGSEAALLDEKEIRDGLIVVNAASAKTRRRRLVVIQPNLKAWLDVTALRGGKLPLRQMHNRLCIAVKASAVPWPDNVTRHTFCSYHLAQFNDPAKTALEAGHTQEMLFGNYRELMTLDGALLTAELAKEFWSITPAA